MNRLSTLILIGLAGLLASCGSSSSSSTQPKVHDEFTVVVAPDQFTLDSGDFASILATVDLSNQNSTPKPIAPQPPIKFFSSDPRVTISPAAEVCAGLWDTRFLKCTPTTLPNGQLDLPTGQVTITAADASHNVTGTTILTVHQHAASIRLTSNWGGLQCISQNDQVPYIATPLDSSGKPIGNVFANDYTWTVADPSVAAAGTFGSVAARNPGVTNVVARLNGTVSAPVAFATCPPRSILLTSSQFTQTTPVGPFTTDDLVLTNGGQKLLTTTLLDTNGKALITSPINFITSDPLTVNLATTLPLVSTLTANTAGRSTVTASCVPPACNASVADFTIPSPTGPVRVSAKSAGFGFPVYSNAIGVAVQGTAGSTVLVTGTTFADGVTPVHRLLTYDSEAMTITHTVALANLPNSMVVAPNGGKAYLGSSAGLVVVDLASFQASIQTFPVAGGVSTDVVTGKVLGVSPDSRFVLISDTSDPNPANHLVFLIDTTVTKVAARFNIPNIDAVTFAADNSNFWIAGDDGVFTFASDTFVHTPTSAHAPVKALAWTPDGQSYFASGSQVVNYSTCDDQNPQTRDGSPINLAATVLAGVPHVFGLSGGAWLDYSVITSAQAVNGAAGPNGNVCNSGVSVNAPTSTGSTLQCPAQQISFAPTLVTGVQPSAFVTGVDPSCTAADPFVHGFDVSAHAEIKLTPTTPIVPLSGGVLNDGRKLFIGTWDKTTKTAALRRFDLAARTEDTATDPTSNQVTIPAPVELVPSFVAVVPK